MRHFDELYKLAAGRKGGPEALEELIGGGPKSAKQIAATPDDRWLAEMTRGVFQAGFNWKVIENKWAGFETAFEGFDPFRWTLMSDEDLDRLLKDTAIVRHAKKIMSVRDNAIFISDLVQEHGSAGVFFAASKPTEYVGLLELMKKRACRLGGTTGQYFLRRMGVDSAVFSRSVCSALIREGVVPKAPTSKRDLAAAQDAFNQWMEEGSVSLTKVSRVLALGVDD